MSISVVFVIKNAIKQGYCFWDSLCSCLPFADEIIISDGYSDDETYEYLLKFKEVHGGKIPIKMFRDKWDDTSYHGEVIAKISNLNLERAKCDWIYYLQADEIIHEDSIDHIKHIASLPDFNAVSFPFHHFIEQWEPSDEGYTEAIRMIRNHRNIYLVGDAWNFEGDTAPVCPAGHSPKPIYHFAWVFPKNNHVKRIEHSKIYKNIDEYQIRMREAVAQIDEPKVAFPVTDFDDFPERAKRFVGDVKYIFPQEANKLVIAINYVDYPSGVKKDLQDTAIAVLRATKPPYVHLVTVNYKHEKVNIGKKFDVLRMLKRNSVEQIGNNRPLPYIKDVFNAVYKSQIMTRNDIFGYINSDILINKKFYKHFSFTKKVGCYMFSRVDIKKVSAANFVNGQEVVISRSHPGIDGFFFRKDWWTHYSKELHDDLILGEPEWDYYYRKIICKHTKHIVEKRALHHIDHKTVWKLNSKGAINNRKINGTI